MTDGLRAARLQQLPAEEASASPTPGFTPPVLKKKTHFYGGFSTAVITTDEVTTNFSKQTFLVSSC